MRFTIDTIRTAFSAINNTIVATTTEPLFAPQRYKGEKPQPWHYGAVVKAPCEQVMS